MSHSLQCPRCHLRVEGRPGFGSESRRCPACGAPLVQPPLPKEADVRRYLYRDSLIPLHRSVGKEKLPVP
ncbi:MAG TPA: hypothetical protein VFI17_01540 [Solirubrobacterales bacterium]|nr:hypothetical protein [Solirubrobacterales bacterium]